MATISHKKNYIVSIRNTEGTDVNDHDQKAALLWNTFKERLGCSAQTRMAYNLNSIIHEQDLSHLDSVFSQ